MKRKIYIIGVLFACGIMAGCNPPAVSESGLPQTQVQISQQSTNLRIISQQSAVTQQSSQATAPTSPLDPQIHGNHLLTPPLPGGLARVTKKDFGLYVSPGHSPVSPERYTGYHTGIDFETYPNEQNIDVHVSAVCTGTLVMKKVATGYGGVAVEACTLEGQPVTIIYGHLRYSSIQPNVQDSLQAGEQFAVLGTGYSSETAGERKHLHLGIHKGTSINILGYVQVKSELSGWLNPLNYF